MPTKPTPKKPAAKKVAVKKSAMPIAQLLESRDDRIAKAKPPAAAAAKLALAARPKPESAGRWTASQSKNYLACPSFYPEYEDPDDDKAAANEGTKLHECVQFGRVSGLEPEQKALVEACLEVQKTVLADLRQEFPARKGFVIEELREQKLPILGGVSNGYIDLLILVRDASRKLVQAVVIDWKFGKVLVDEAKVNAQGWNYLDALMTVYKPSRVKIMFVQPKRDFITVHDFEKAEADEVRKALQTGYLATRLPHQQRPHNLTPGVCDWCGRKTQCPAFLKLTAAVVKSSRENLTPEQEKALKTIRDVSVETITDPELANALFVLTSPLKKLIDSVKDQTTQLLLAGYDLPDVELGSRDGRAELKLTPAELRDEIKKNKLFDGILDPKLVTEGFIDNLLEVKSPTKLGDQVKDVLRACAVEDKQVSALNSELTRRFKARGFVGYGFATFNAKLKTNKD